jgi:hypothetical protein
MSTTRFFSRVNLSWASARRCEHHRMNRSRNHHPDCERLEYRCMLSGSPPSIPYGPLPAVTVGLTDGEVDRADAVINWNATMSRAIWNAATPPTWASRVEAMVGVTVYDAVDGIDPIDAVYPIPGLTAQPAQDAARNAAAIAAADTVLNSLYPDQRAMFDAEYKASIESLPDNRRTAGGITWGRAVASALLAWRSQDGSDTVVNYIPAPPGGPPGQYELTPGVTATLTPQWGQVTPWAMISATQFLPPPPPALDSAEYAADFNYTKSVGGVDSSTRTVDQTQFAHFWADVPGRSVTPPGHWDEIAEHVSLQRHLNIEQNAHLFALLNIGLADAAISCWDAKYLYNLWRPVTAINDPRASQINTATTSDPSWTPLWKTPNFPSYTSGHSTFSGAADVILTAIFGSDTVFTIGSDDMPGYSRSFTSFAQAANEAGESRIFGGIHFEFDNHAGLQAGRALGAYIASDFLLLLDNSANGRLSSGQGSSAPHRNNQQITPMESGGSAAGLRERIDRRRQTGSLSAPMSSAAKSRLIKQAVEESGTIGQDGAMTNRSLFWKQELLIRFVSGER